MTATIAQESPPGNRPSIAAGISPLRRLLELFGPDRADVWTVVVFAIVNGALLLATPIAVQSVVNFVAFGASVPSIAILSGLLFVSLGAGASMVAAQTWIVEILQRRMFVRLVADLADRLPRLSWRVRDHYYGPELVNRFFDVVTIQKTGSVLLLDGLANLLSITVGLSVLAFYHPYLLVFDIVLLGAIIAILYLPVRRGTRTAIDESEVKYEVAGWLEEITRHPLAFKTPGSENYARAKSTAVAKAYVDTRRVHYRTVFGQILSALGLDVAAGTAVLGIGGWLVIVGELSLGQLVAAELVVVLVTRSVAKLGKLAEKYYDLVAAVDKVGKLLDLEVEAPSAGAASIESPASGPARLEARDVVLPHCDEQVTAPIRLQAAPGEVVGIRGRHGAGKSLLIESLYRLRTCPAGTLTLDGTHYEDIDLCRFREAVAIAAEPEILEATVLDNVVLGRTSFRLDDVHEALGAVGLLDRIHALPDGLGTALGPTGAPLSSGERRRLVLARAILGRPRLLLIDGLLDGISERGRETIKRGVFDQRDRWTVVIASSRPDVLTLCDRTIQIDAEETAA